MSNLNSFSKYAPYVTLGLEIAISIALPILAGYWVDDYFNTKPWFILLGCVIGIINLFLLIIRVRNQLNDK